MTNTTWTLRDAMRLSHPRGVDKAVGNFILRGEVTTESPAILRGFAEMQRAQSVKDVLAVLAEYRNLPWETIPTQFLKAPEVWKALFNNGALNGQALLRNVTRLARIGAFDDMVFAADYAKRLADPAMIARTRLHPMAFLNALVVYSEGQIDRQRSGMMHTYRNMDWRVNSKIKNALNKGFYEAFKHTTPANKRTLIGLDVSGSMQGPASGLELTCGQVAAALSMTILRSEPYVQIHGFAAEFRDLGITEDMSLEQVMAQAKANTFGRTDCALPMLWAAENNVKVDTFVIVTDNDTRVGYIKPSQALAQYRSKTGIDAKLVVAAVNSSPFSIADPRDPGMLDIVGGDANLPRLVSEFSAGRL